MSVGSSYVTLTSRPARDPITRTLHPERDLERDTEVMRRPSRTVEGVRPDTTHRWTGGRAAFWAAALAVAAITVALRVWNQAGAYELFMDEIQYADVANSFAAGRGPELFGQPFFLHPPLFFVFVSQVISAPVPHMTVHFVLGLRAIELIFATANVLLVIGVARRVVRPWAALLAGVVYALDPFVVRFDSRLMIEAPMMTSILVGVLAALIAVDRDRRVRHGWLVVAGLAFGLAIVTKSTAALITSVPLVLMLATSWGLRRKEALVVFGVQCSVYAAYLLWVVGTGNTAAWYEQTVAGTLRAVGVVKETGFSSVGFPSFTDRLVANLTLVGPSYLLIAIACGYAVYLLFIGWRSLRAGGAQATHALRGDGDDLGLLNCWFAGVLVGIAYTFVLGEVEEQTFYMLAVPSTVVISLLMTQTASWRQLPRVAMAAIVAVTVIASGAVWWRVHTTSDDTYRQLETYVGRHIPERSQIALGEANGQFVLPGYGLHKMTSLEDARRTSSRFALVSTTLSQLGLAPARGDVTADLAAHYTPVFVAEGRTVGELRLYDLARPINGAKPVVPASRTPGFWP